MKEIFDVLCEKNKKYQKFKDFMHIYLTNRYNKNKITAQIQDKIHIEIVDQLNKKFQKKFTTENILNNTFFRKERFPQIFEELLNKKPTEDGYVNHDVIKSIISNSFNQKNKINKSKDSLDFISKELNLNEIEKKYIASRTIEYLGKVVIILKKKSISDDLLEILQFVKIYKNHCIKNDDKKRLKFKDCILKIIDNHTPKYHKDNLKDNEICTQQKCLHQTHLKFPAFNNDAGSHNSGENSGLNSLNQTEAKRVLLKRTHNDISNNHRKIDKNVPKKVRFADQIPLPSIQNSRSDYSARSSESHSDDLKNHDVSQFSVSNDASDSQSSVFNDPSESQFSVSNDVSESQSSVFSDSDSSSLDSVACLNFGLEYAKEKYANYESTKKYYKKKN